MPSSHLKNIPHWLVPLAVGLLGQAFMGRNNSPWTLTPGLLLLAISFLWFRHELKDISPRGKDPLPMRQEWIFGIAILLAAIFFRCFQIGRVPSGIYLDAGGLGLGSERIVREGWRPFYEIYGLPVPDMAYCYQLAGWFWIWGVSRFTLFSFSIFISLLGLVAAYFAFRRLGGQGIALLAAAFMGLGRWYLTFSRCAHPSFEVPFYLCGAIVFWIAAMESDRWWAWLGSLAFLSIGCYSDRILWAVPILFLAWAFYEWKLHRPKDRRHWLLRCSIFFASCFFLTAPAWGYRIFGHRFDYWKGDVWFADRFKDGGLPVLATHLGNYILMFFRQADSWPVHNWSNHRVLDPVTGLLALFGLIFLFREWRQRSSFYVLSGLVVMSLPAVLSAADGPVSRSIGTLPFIAFLAGRTGIWLWSQTKKMKDAVWNRASKGLLLLLLGFVAVDNFYTYFFLQSGQPGTYEAHCADATAVGEELAGAPEKEIYLSPRFFGNLDVDFLAFDKRPNFTTLYPWNLPAISQKHLEPVLFVLDEGKTGFIHLLQKVFPGGALETTDQYFKGWPLAYFYRVPAGSPGWKGHLGGIQGIYQVSGSGGGPMVLTREDPILNFTFRNDFGLEDFKTLSIRWTGMVKADQAGVYSFLTLTTDQSAVNVDGRKILEGDENQEGTVFLSKGWHRIAVDFQKLSGVDTAFNLLWKLPGTQNYQIVPFWQWPAPVKAPNA